MKVAEIMNQINAGHLEEVAKEIEHIKKSSNEDEIFSLAEELLEIGFLDEAKELYQVLLNRFPEESIIRVNLAEIAIEQGDEEGAVLLLEKIDNEDDLYPSALLLLADCYESFEMYEVSEAKLTLANQVLPNEPIIQFALAEIYFLHGNYSDALKQYQRIAIPEINGVTVAGRVAESLFATGKFEEAIPFFEKVADQLDVNQIFQYGLSALYTENLELAKRQFDRVIQQDAEYHSAYYYLAKTHAQMHQIDEALACVNKGIGIDRTSKELWLLSAQLLIQRQELIQAAVSLENALAIDPSYIEAIATLARLRLVQDDFQAVISLLQSAIAENETDPEFDWLLASAYVGIEDYDLANKYFSEAYSIFSENTEFLEEYGPFLLEMGDLTAAKQVFHRLCTLDPSNEEYLDILDRLER